MELLVAMTTMTKWKRFNTLDSQPMNEFEITIQDIINILVSHDTKLPYDVSEKIYDELSEYFPEIVHDALNFSTDLKQQTDFVYSALERIMITDGIYITEPAIWEIRSVYRTA